MIYQNTELFNVDHVTETAGGVFLRRFPDSVVDFLGETDNRTFGKYVARMTTGCEIRLCGDRTAVTLSCWEADGWAEVYRGDYFHSRHRIQHGVQTTLMLSEVGTRLMSYKPEAGRFANNIWRIVFAHDFCGVLHSIEHMAAARSPRLDELPSKTMLAYGSSITHGANSTTISHAYVHVAARHLGVDVLNKGMGGSCLCEPQMAEYIAAAPNWDFAVLELGINMLGTVETPEFEKRASVFVKTVLRAGKPIFLLTMFPCFNIFPRDDLYTRYQEYQAALRQIGENLRSAGVTLIEGTDILTDFTGLTCDLIHPSDYGHALMGANLAAHIAPELQ